MKILIINPFGIGDVIFSTPLIEILKRNFSDSFIGYICNRRVSQLLTTNPSINKVFIYEKDDYRRAWQQSKIGCIKKILSFLKSIKKESFDISIDLSLGYYYSMALKAAGIKKRFGFNYRNRGKFLTRKIGIDGFDYKHVIEYYLDILKLLDIDVKKYRIAPKVYLADIDRIWADKFLKENNVAEKDMVIGMVPGCGASWGVDAKFRRWDRENFATVCDKLIDKYKAKVILFGDPKEIEICESMQKLVKNQVIIACGKTKLGELLGLLNKCNLVITNEGGPLHMAIALGIKTVSIFGPVDEKVYGPYPSNSDHIVVSQKNIPCRPCYKKFKYQLCEDRLCLKSISIDEVLKAVEQVLKS